MVRYETTGEERHGVNANTSSWRSLGTRAAGLAGLLGGVLWALWPLGTDVFFGEATRSGVQAVAAFAYALLPLVPAALIVLGLVGLQKFHGDTYGRLGAAGTAVSAGALAVMAGGLALEGFDIFVLEETSLSGIAHGGFFLGFLALLIGSIVLGVAVRRADRLLRARWLGLLLVIAIPAGIAMVILKETIAPTPVDSDLWFWIAFTTAYGIAWAALGHHMRLTERSMDSTIGSAA